MEWKVELAQEAEYHIDALLGGKTSQSFNFSVLNTSYSLNFSPTINEWDKIDCGKITLPAGISTIRFTKTTSDSTAVYIKAFELMKETDRPAYLQRINEFKKDTTWLANAKYGLMFQYGVWGYPQTGDKKSMEDSTNAFDVPKFVQMVKDSGASYVIWSITWYQYRMQAPILAVNDIMGNNSLTTTRDLIGEIATALKDEGINFTLYYHTGLNQEPTWRAKQNWPTNNEFTLRGTGDRTTFFDNWVKVITEIGNRYGDKLDGWFFDDGVNYYPAPFEAMGEAARAGNPNRLICYNPASACRVTDFQDVFMGENYHGQSTTGSAPAGGNGVFLSGGHKGLLYQSMFCMENDWGIYKANTVITPSSTVVSSADAWLASAMPKKAPLSFCMMMYEDGTVSQTSFDVLKALKAKYVDNNFRIENTSTLKSDGTGNIKLTRLTGYNSTSMNLVVALYNANNKMVSCSAIPIDQTQIPTSIGNTTDIPIAIQLPSNYANCSVKLFAFCNFGNIQPLAVSQSISNIVLN